MLPVVWLSSVRDDLRQILLTFLAKIHSLACRMKRFLEASVLPLAEHPYLYKKSGKVSGLREIVAHPNYLILYRVAANQIEIVAVVHARREFPIFL
ncbi:MULTISPECIES: type II toxin-antitoxin system RelE/ParE family toxin [unclassified Bartonella]|uniref:type II toxin-antitoxin system RelE/ParE family toxin n=1 Tax=unclassified Bartonella TaxID=2645622 RepID=UPI0035CEFEAF